jgi:hypothetical protein
MADGGWRMADAVSKRAGDFQIEARSQTDKPRFNNGEKK